jgi:preprotein translocase subunit SecG
MHLDRSGCFSLFIIVVIVIIVAKDDDLGDVFGSQRSFVLEEEGAEGCTYRGAWGFS